MIFNELIFVACLSTQLDLIGAAGNYDPDNFDGLEDLPWWSDFDENNHFSVPSGSKSPETEKCSRNKRPQNETSSSNKSTSKSPRNETCSGTKNSKKEQCTSRGVKRIRQKYNSHITPINPKIDDNMVDYLRKWEKKLQDIGKYCVWENFYNIPLEDAKKWCVGTWTILGQLLPEIKKNDGMIPDCEPSLIGGPSETRRGYKNYHGFFQYLGESSKTKFLPDLVRCNCAYTKWSYYKNSMITANKSKRFFFLFRHPDKVYYVLTILGSLSSRNVKIVNVLTEESLLPTS